MQNKLTKIIQQLGKQAKDAAVQLAQASTSVKNQVLTHLEENIDQHRKQLLLANQLDQVSAQESGQAAAMIDRLVLSEQRIDDLIKSLVTIISLDDPVGRNLAEWDRPNQLLISRVSVPFGVIGIIYESRPNVTIDAAALCIKSGNAAILRAGSECFCSSSLLVELIQQSLASAGLPRECIQLLPTKEREAVTMMLKLDQYIDLIIPRGGTSLTTLVAEQSRIPTLLHLTGNCHTYIHSAANHELALKVLLNAKMRRTGICGATESLVIDYDIGYSLLSKLVDALLTSGCEVRGDRRAQALDNRITRADEEDFGSEYLAAIISVKVVDNVREAITHINHYGSHHTDAILTEDASVAEQFLRAVDSAIVMHNTSTQFADGGEFGMGAEIGIATGRLHARGPVGLEQLTTYKYLVRGNGQLRG